MQRPQNLLRNGEFVKLWLGQTVSVFGSQITGLALPLTAALVLHATPEQMGVLGALYMLPYALFGLFAGVWVDRVRRRPLLIAGDLGRALVLGLIPLAAVLGVLNIGHIYAVAFVAGSLTVFFEIAYLAYVPALVSSANIVEANSKLEVSRSAAQIAGPGVAGVLIDAFGAPLAILLDALSFLVSGMALLLIRAPEPARPVPAAPVTWRRDLTTGLRLIFAHPVLRTITLTTAGSVLFDGMLGAVFLLFLTRDLGLEPSVIGLIIAAGAPGALIGALLGQRVTRRLGLGRTIGLSLFAAALVQVLIPLATTQVLVAAVLLVVVELVRGLTVVVYNINVISLRQAITPDALLGRVNASARFVVLGTYPAGALLGGLLGSQIGLRPTLVVVVVGMLVASLLLLASPVRAVRDAQTLAKIE